MCDQPTHCTCLCISHGLWVLGVGGWAKGWGGGQGGGPAQMLSRVYTWYIPGISIYLVYTRYILQNLSKPNMLGTKQSVRFRQMSGLLRIYIIKRR